MFVYLFSTNLFSTKQIPILYYLLLLTIFNIVIYHVICYYLLEYYLLYHYSIIVYTLSLYNRKLKDTLHIVGKWFKEHLTENMKILEGSSYKTYMISVFSLVFKTICIISSPSKVYLRS